MDNQDVIGKRKKPRKECPNPLFVHWLKEWADDAAAKGMKSQYVYRKALTALTKYPLTLENGKACKVLECFGDKICKMLDDKLENYIAEYGTTEPIPGVIDVPGLKPKTKSAKTIKKNKTVCEADSDEQSPAKKKQRGGHDDRRRKSGPKEYIPRYRTGGYALILALHKKEQAADYEGYMAKESLMNEAQPFATESFRIPDPGSRYTAWSTMGTLRKKGFVHSWSNPAKYSLTDTGRDLALKIKQQEALGLLPGMDKDMGTTSRIGFTVGGSVGQNRNRNGQHPALPTIASSDDDSDSGMHANGKPSEHAASCGSSRPVECEFVVDSDTDDGVGTGLSRVNLPSQSLSKVALNMQSSEPERLSGLRYWYVAEDGSEHLSKDKAQVTIDDNIGVGFLIKCRYCDLLTSGKKYVLDHTRSGSGEYTYGFLADSDADNVTTPPIDSGGIGREFLSGTDSIDRKIEPNTSTANTRSWPKAREWKTNSVDSQGSACSAASVASSHKSIPDPDFVLKPGSFDVTLCVDMQEKASKMAQQVLQPELKKNGIQYELRKLQVGDFLWIARPKCGGQAFGRDGVPAEERELVLDYIIERKRMDDLASSIIDGRFREQKFRLKGCGLKQAIYLVEDYGSAQHYSISEDALNQAITNTQVIDEFYVRRTKDLRDSITYLTIMTRYIQSVYSSKKLVACKASALSEPGIANHADSQEQYLMTYKEFNSRTTKNKPLTVKEMFVKQLVQISGLTVEKACSITDLYHTPKRLVDALETCLTETDRDNLLEGVKSGSNKRNMGKQMAQQVAKLYSTKVALT